jgi:hypothetical protein
MQGVSKVGGTLFEIKKNLDVINFKLLCQMKGNSLHYSVFLKLIISVIGGHLVTRTGLQ